MAQLIDFQPSLAQLVEQGLTSHSTQFRLFRRRRFYSPAQPTGM